MATASSSQTTGLYSVRLHSFKMSYKLKLSSKAEWRLLFWKRRWYAYIHCNKVALYEAKVHVCMNLSSVLANTKHKKCIV